LDPLREFAICLHEVGGFHGAMLGGAISREPCMGDQVEFQDGAFSRFSCLLAR